jgi:peptidoglycan/LPS O-acetylase OafA/YrhL
LLRRSKSIKLSCVSHVGLRAIRLQVKMSNSSSSYIPNVDAMRAISIIAVMAFHARYFAAGWVGVWVFFVISGFLITRSLVGLSGAGFWQGLKVFYIRRSLRIWPAYYVYVLLCTIAILAAGLTQVRGQIMWCVFYLANLMPVFGVDDSGRLFGHLWSLAVEEQYYLIIAPVVLLLGRRWCVPLFLALIVLVPLFRAVGFAWLAPHYGAQTPELIKGLTPFQVDSFMIGGAIALFEDRIRALPGRTVSLWSAAIVAVCLGALVLNYYALGMQHAAGGANLDRSQIEQWRLSPTSFGIAINTVELYGYVWLYSVLSLLSAVLLVGVIRLGSRYQFTTLNAIGKVSYGMYLFHSPMVSAFDQILLRAHIAKMTPLGVACFICLVGAVYVVSLASFKWLEAPLLRLKDRIATAPRSGASAPALSTPLASASASR